MSYKINQSGSLPKCKIPAQLLRGENDENKNELIHSWIACKEIRGKLKKVLDNELKNCYNKTEKEDFLSAPNLTERMAFNNGLCSGLKGAIKLLGDDNSND